MRRIKLHLLLPALFLSLTVFSQSPDKNTDRYELNNFYNEHIGASASLYSGPAYVPLTYRMKGSPFLAADTLTMGWIVYDGQYYPQASLQWDVFQNYVLTQSLASVSRLVLRNDLIDSFYYAGHLVKFMQANKEHNLNTTGFYDILYNGPTSLIAKRKRTMESRIEDMTVVYHFFDRSTYYINKNDLYYMVSNKKDVLNLFPQNRSGIKREVRRNKLRWRKDFEQALLIATIHYDKANTIK